MNSATSITPADVFFGFFRENACSAALSISEDKESGMPSCPPCATIARGTKSFLIYMTNNDILRRLRYALNLTNGDVANAITHTGVESNPAQVRGWLAGEEEEGFSELTDPELCRFLDGLIIEKRGARPESAPPEPLDFLSTNEVLKKLRIALSMRDEEMLAIFGKAEFVVTKAELGSFFRKEGQRNFSKCPEQVLRKFIHGLGMERDEKEVTD